MSKVLAFPITRDDGDSGDFLVLAYQCSSVVRFWFSDHPMSRSPDLFAALCLRPSARNPTPLTLLLITKAQPQFDSPVDRTVVAFLRVFQWSNLVQFQPSFSAFTVRSAEGRNGLELFVFG
jgi:hypothetical protein